MKTKHHFNISNETGKNSRASCSGSKVVRPFVVVFIQKEPQSIERSPIRCCLEREGAVRRGSSGVHGEGTFNPERKPGLDGKTLTVWVKDCVELDE